MSDVKDDDLGELEVVEAQIEAQQQVEDAKPETEDDVPQQFRGKDFRSVAQYAYNLEKSLSKQGKELGDLRKLTDDLIKSQLKPAEPQQEQKPPVDFFENPEEAINRAVETHPKVQQAEQFALAARREMAKQQLQQLHPDMNQVLQDDDFRKWVSSSPVRQMLLRQADQSYDVSAAHELFSTFKELKATRMKQDDSMEKESRSKALKSAAVDMGGSGDTPRKVYSRRAIRELQIKNPAKFAAMRNEIDAAYRDGRIKP